MPLNRKTIKFWLSLSRYASFFSYILTLFVNVLLIILTGWYIKRKFGTYKYLIIIFSTIGLIFDSLDIIIMPMVHSVSDGIVYFALVESTYISQNVLTHLLALYSGWYHVSSAFLAVMFIHRYFSVTRPEQLFFFQEKRILLWVSYSLTAGLSVYLSAMFFGELDDFSKAYMSEEILENYGRVITELPTITLITHDENSNIRWGDVYTLSNALFFVMLQNTMIIFCGYKIRRKIYSKTSNYSVSLRKLHSQFFKTLVFQVATPTFLLFIPIIVMLYFPLIGFKANFPAGISFGLVGFYPAIDSCIVMYIITEYKTAIRDFLNDVRMFLGFSTRRKYDK